MYAGFRERANAVQDLLLSPHAGFCVVTGPEPEPGREAADLWRRLAEDGYPLLGLVLNRVHPLPAQAAPPVASLSAALGAAGAADPEELAERAVASLEEARVLGLRDLDTVEGLRTTLGRPPITRVPAFTPDPVDLTGLARVTAELLP
jgi:anion-transporting  ArsA/GET3 family ATPase